jgi:hypothetical protein
LEGRSDHSPTDGDYADLVAWAGWLDAGSRSRVVAGRRVTREYDRTGLDVQTTQVLDVTLPLVTVPLNPGKNLTVICEVVAMNHLLRYSGVDTARAFNDRLLKRLAERRELQEYLEEDNE